MEAVEVRIGIVWRHARIFRRTLARAMKHPNWWTNPTYPVQVVTPYGWATLRVVANQIRPVTR